MNLMLTDFMQTVSLKDPKNPKTFLVFRNERGEELRVPVGPDAIEALTRFAFSQPQEPVEEEQGDMENMDAPPESPGGTLPGGPEEELEDETDATTFGGDVEEGGDVDDEDPVRPFELSRPGPPRSEAEIKSL